MEDAEVGQAKLKAGAWQRANRLACPQVPVSVSQGCRENHHKFGASTHWKFVP